MAIHDSPEILGYMIVHNEQDILDEVLAYYSRMRIPLLVVDNGSTDDSLDMLQRACAQGHIIVVSYPTMDYDLRHLLEITVLMALARKPRWLLHIDADHFYDPPDGILDFLTLAREAEKQEANVVNFPEYCFRQTDEDLPSATVTAVQERLRFYEPCVGELQQPRFFRAMPGVDVHSNGGHSIHFKEEDTRWFSRRGVLRHYPFRSIEQGREKLKLRRQRYSCAGKARGWHRQYGDMAEDGWIIRQPVQAGLLRWDGVTPLDRIHRGDATR